MPPNPFKFNRSIIVETVIQSAQIVISMIWVVSKWRIQSRTNNLDRNFHYFGSFKMEFSLGPTITIVEIVEISIYRNDFDGFLSKTHRKRGMVQFSFILCHLFYQQIKMFYVEGISIQVTQVQDFVSQGWDAIQGKKK